jgi:UDP-N-acetylmuramoylalanine--D-glutamate ligase
MEIPIEKTPTLQSAVKRAAEIAQPGDAVLLSPACSSYDMFDNYEQRGERFRTAVQAFG